MMLKLTRRVFLALLCLAAAALAQGQENLAVVRGSVYDPHHRAVPAARVHLTATGTGVQCDVVACVPQMDLRQWNADRYAQDNRRVTANTTLDYGVRYEYMASLVDIEYTNSNLDLSSSAPRSSSAVRTATRRAFSTRRAPTSRAEFFNALNHTNLVTPNRFVNTSSFATIPEASTPGREIQVSARLSF
ncbi:MAG TPA: hypothetical protein VGL22_07490 [Terracidiphilus sp.]